MNTNKIIEINNLIKKYGNESILDIPMFYFERGKSYLLVGSNGSGKSTLIKVLLGFIKRNNGEVILNTNSISYLPERIQKIDFLTIREYLNTISYLDRKTIKSEILKQYSDIFEIDLEKRIDKLSKGMLQKVMIISTLILDKELIILDEPLNGLDKRMQERFIYLINEERKKNKTIIISTHYPYTYNGVYDYIIRINNHNLVFDNEIN